MNFPIRNMLGISALTCSVLACASAPSAGTASAPVVQSPTGPVPNPSRMVPTNALNETERSIVAAVDPRNAEGLALLERVVNINSGTMNFAGVKQVGDIFRKELDALGFETRWVDGAAFGRSGHLIAERSGTGPRMLLIGHLDTVFEPTSPFQKFEKITDSTARGPGVIGASSA